MKCDKCNNTYQQNNVALSVGEIKICIICVDSASSGSDNVIVNELLAYIDTYRHSSSKQRMREACSGFYTEWEISNAKRALHSKKPRVFGEYVKRQDSTVGGRTKEEANLDDIYDWFRKLDDIDLSITFCAKNLRRVPRFNPEEAERTSILDRIIKLEESMIAQKGTHLALIGRTSKLEEKVFNGSESLENEITQVNESLTKTDTKIVEMSNEDINIDKEIKSQIS